MHTDINPDLIVSYSGFNWTAETKNVVAKRFMNKIRFASQMSDTLLWIVPNNRIKVLMTLASQNDIRVFTRF